MKIETSPLPQSETLDTLHDAERRHTGPFDHGRLLDEMARRTGAERYDPLSVLTSDLRHYERVRGEHFDAWRRSVKHFIAVRHLPPSARRDRQMAFARDSITHEKASFRVWTAKTAETRRRLGAALMDLLAA